MRMSPLLSSCISMGLLVCVCNAAVSSRFGHLLQSRPPPSSFVQLSNALLTKNEVAAEPSNLYVGEIVQDHNVLELAPGDVIVKEYVLGKPGNPPARFLAGALPAGQQSPTPAPNNGKHSPVTHYLLITRRIAQTGKGLLFLVEPFNPETGRIIAVGGGGALPVTTWSQDLKWLYGYRYIGRSKAPGSSTSFIQRTALENLDVNNDFQRLDRTRFIRVFRATASGRAGDLRGGDAEWLQQINAVDGVKVWQEILEALHTKSTKTKNAKVVVSGAGPTGLTAALLLTIAGYDVDLFEARCAYTRRHIVDVTFASSMNGPLVSQLNSQGLEKALVHEFFLRQLGNAGLTDLLNGYGMASVLATFGFMHPTEFKLADKNKPPIVSADIPSLFNQVLTKNTERQPHTFSVVISDLEKLLYSTFLILRTPKSTASFSGCTQQQSFSQVLRANAYYAKARRGDIGPWIGKQPNENTDKLRALYPARTARTAIIHAEGGSSYFRKAVGSAAFPKQHTLLSPPFSPFTATFRDWYKKGAPNTPVEVAAAPDIDWAATLIGKRADELVPSNFKVFGDKADDTPLTAADIAPMYMMVVVNDPERKICRKIQENNPVALTNQPINNAISSKLIYTGHFVMSTKLSLSKCQIELGVRPSYTNVFKALFPSGFRWPRAGAESVEFQARANLLIDIVKGVLSPVGTLELAIADVLEMKIWESRYGYATLAPERNDPSPVVAARDLRENTHVLLGDAARDPYTSFAMGVNDGAFSAMHFVSSLMADEAGVHQFARDAPRRIALTMKNIHQNVLSRITHQDNLKPRLAPDPTDKKENCAKFVRGLCLRIDNRTPTIVHLNNDK